MGRSSPSRAPRRRAFSVRATLAAFSLVVLLVALAASARYFMATRSVRSSAGVDLGRLTSGSPRDRVNLVIVTLDTTRADRMGAYGNTEVETPTFDRLAREGVLFEQAVSVAPLTLPVHSSMFTGKFPPEHGVRDNGGVFLRPAQGTLAALPETRGAPARGLLA